MAQQQEIDGVHVGSRWRRKPPGKETVRIGRVWIYRGEPTVRAHPTNGGRYLVAPIAYLRDHYTEADR